MRGQFGPDDEEAFYAARDSLVDRFEATPEGRYRRWIATQVLDFKWGYFDDDLADWRDEHISEILLVLYPAKVMLEPADLAEVVTGFAAFLRFLPSEGLLPATEAERLADLVERLGPRFHAAALDSDNWSMGKRVLHRAMEAGADPTDPEALQRSMDEFNELTPTERDAVLGPLPAISSDVIGPLPPVVLEPAEVLESLAAGTVWVERLKRLVAYVGPGRPITDAGNLKLADGKELVGLLGTDDRIDQDIGGRVFRTRSSTELRGVDLTFRTAVEAGLLAVERRKVVPGPAADRTGLALDTLYAALLAFIHRIGPTQYHYRNHNYGWDWYAAELDGQLPVLLIDLYRYGATEIEELIEDVWHHLNQVYDLTTVPADKLEFHRGLVDHSLRRALDHLADMAIVTISGVVETPTPYGTVDKTGGEVELAPLGLWAVQRLASRVTSAPVVGTMREATAGQLLTRASDLPVAEAVAEVDAWVAHRGAEAAAAELVDALAAVDETGRGLGFRALLRIGAVAAPEVDRLRSHPELEPYVTVWRIDTLTGTEEDMDCGGDAERFVRLLAAVIELWGPAAATSGWAVPAAGSPGIDVMLEAVWQVRHPQTETVLAAIGDHPDKAVAKAARKAMFRHRSSPT
jgi:hypothetical protein